MNALIRWFFTALVRVYYPVRGIEGANKVPWDDACLFVLNHPNGLLDPLVLRIVLGRPVGFLGKSTLFKNPISRAVMVAFGGLPVARRQDVSDGGGDMANNLELFARCREALSSHQWLALFPEGTSHSDPQLKPLKTGAARIALSTEAEFRAAHGKALGLKVVPVGLIYEQKVTFRSRALVVVGEAIQVSERIDDYQRDEREAVDALTDTIRDRLDQVLLQADTRALLEGVARVAVWTHDTPDLRDDLAKTHQRSRALLDAYKRLQIHNPVRASAIVEETQRFVRMVDALGIRDPWAVELHSIGIAHIVWMFLKLVLLAPMACVGVILGWIPYRIAGVVAARVTPQEDVRSTGKALVGVVFVLLTWIVEAMAVGARYGVLWGLGVMAAAILGGYAALQFEEDVSVIIEAWRVWRLRTSHVGAARAIIERRMALSEAVREALVSKE
jgi:glycerol-3-phosphate O-acyltransferase / dihydroxyacetone phosphate acyltransferase